MTARRREIIKRLLSREPIPSQGALLGRLREQGIDATQATVSRDLRALGVVKTRDGYELERAGARREIPSVVEEMIAEHVLTARAAANLVVLKTGPGRAQVVAVELDRAPPPGVVGTIAGDDTIFLALDSEIMAQSLCDRIRQELGIDPVAASGVAS